MSRPSLPTTITIAILAGGVIILGFFQFKTSQDLEELKKSGTEQTAKLPIKTLSSDSEEGVVDPSLSAETEEIIDLTSLQASVSALVERVETLEKSSGIKTTAAPATSTKTFQKETLSLGSATSTHRDWTNSGLETTIDSADYPSTVSVHLEAGLSIIGGEVSARIINKTNGAIISSTEISNNSSEIIWRTSGSFKPHFGKNTYVVQIRSSSSETANVTGAKLVVK